MNSWHSQDRMCSSPCNHRRANNRGPENGAERPCGDQNLIGKRTNWRGLRDQNERPAKHIKNIPRNIQGKILFPAKQLIEKQRQADDLVNNERQNSHRNNRCAWNRTPHPTKRSSATTDESVLATD